MTFVAVTFFRYPHPLPLLRSDTSGRLFLSVDGCDTLYAVLFGFENRNTLDTVQINFRHFAVEQIHLQVRFDLGQRIILVRQFHPNLTDVIHRLLEC